MDPSHNDQNESNDQKESNDQNRSNKVPQLNNTTLADLLQLTIFFKSNQKIFISFMMVGVIFSVGYFGFRVADRLVNEWDITPQEHIRTLNDQNNDLIIKYNITATSTRLLVKSQADFIDLSLYPQGKESKERISIYALDKDVKKTDSYHFRQIPLDIQGTKKYFTAHKNNQCINIDNRDFGPDSFVMTRFGPNYLVTCPISEDNELLGMVFLLWQDARTIDKKKVEQKFYRELLIENRYAFKEYLKDYKKAYLESK